VDIVHTAPMQLRPGLQAVPPQHVSPCAPQVGVMPELIEHVPPWHARPMLHAAPPQHVSPIAPHEVIPVLMRHVPDMHARPGLQAVPQHICMSPPHAAGAALHTPPMSHTSPGLHELPLQHVWSRSPHGAGIVQRSDTHASVPVQVEPGQQGCASRPHALHMPIRHV